MSDKESNIVPLKQRIKTLVKKPDGLWFFANSLGLLSSLIYILRPLVFRDNGTFLYKIIILLSVVSDGLVYVKNFQLKSFKKSLPNISKYINSEPFAYILLAFILLSLRPVYGSIIPFNLRFIKNVLNYTRKDILILLQPGIQEELIKYKLNPRKEVNSKLSKLYLKLQNINLKVSSFLSKTIIMSELFLLPISLMLTSLFYFKMLPILLYAFFIKIRISYCKPFNILLVNLLSLNLPYLKPLLDRI